MGIEESDPRWKCCCSSIHVKTGAIVIGVLGIIWAVLQIASGAYLMSQGYDYFTRTGGSEVGAGLLCLVSSILVIKGVKDINPCMLVLHLVLLVLYMIMSSISICFVIYAGAWIAKAEAGDEATSLMAQLWAWPAAILPIIGVLLLIILIVQIWLFRVILRCRQYLQLQTEEMSDQSGRRVYPSY